jgi:ribose transport system substrate-binding protein
MSKKLLFVVLIAAFVVGMTGCTTSPTAAPATAAPAQGTPVISASGSMSDQVAISLGWQENASGQRFTQGYEEALKKIGWKYVISNANYDPKLQSEQIDAFIQLKPKAMFVTCSDPVGITAAVSRAIAAGIPVFTADCNIAGIKQITSIASNNYGMGMYTMDYIAKAIGGTGKVGMIGLPNNETWDLRELGARYVLSNYPNIQIVYWPYDSTGAVTPGQAVQNMLTANKDIKAIWCAWDGAAMEGALGAEAAGLKDVIFTGIDGGQQAFDQIKTGGDFKLSMAQSIYWMSWMDVQYAQDYLANKKVPRYVVAPVYAATKELLDAVPSGVNAADYDIPGMEVKLGWTPVK